MWQKCVLVTILKGIIKVGFHFSYPYSTDFILIIFEFFFSMNPDPLVRNTFWTVTMGGFCLTLTAIAIHPGSVQRFISLPTIAKAEW